MSEPYQNIMEQHVTANDDFVPAEISFYISMISTIQSEKSQ